MSYRNAFTHGEISTDGTRVWLSYFEGKPQKAELTDAYLEGVESALVNGCEQLKQLAKALQVHSCSES